MGSEAGSPLAPGRGMSPRDLLTEQKLATEEAALFALVRQLVDARWSMRADGQPPHNPPRMPDGTLIPQSTVDSLIGRLRAAEASRRGDAERINATLDGMTIPPAQNTRP